MQKWISGAMGLILVTACESAIVVGQRGLPAGVPGSLQARSARQPIAERYILKGLAQLPTGFRTQATSADIIGNANVTLVTSSGMPVAAGLTDAAGAFTIYESTAPFSPNANDRFYLDVAKRFDTGSYVNTLSLRTIVEWNGTAWTSTTGTTIVVNSATTAVALTQMGDGAVTMADAIDAVTMAGTTATFNGLGSYTAGQLQARETAVLAELTANRDPLGDVPQPTPWPSPTAWPEPTPWPSPTAWPEPTPWPSPTAWPEPTPWPSPTPWPTPTATSNPSYGACSGVPEFAGAGITYTYAMSGGNWSVTFNFGSTTPSGSRLEWGNAATLGSVFADDQTEVTSRSITMSEIPRFTTRYFRIRLDNGCGVTTSQTFGLTLN